MYVRHLLTYDPAVRIARFSLWNYRCKLFHFIPDAFNFAGKDAQYKTKKSLQIICMYLLVVVRRTTHLAFHEAFLDVSMDEFCAYSSGAQPDGVQPEWVA